ncbi:MAG: hypothetical protein AB7N76_05290 [Planctomycetota bacterium]
MNHAVFVARTQRRWPDHGFLLPEDYLYLVLYNFLMAAETWDLATVSRWLDTAERVPGEKLMYISVDLCDGMIQLIIELCHHFKIAPPNESLLVAALHYDLRTHPFTEEEAAGSCPGCRVHGVQEP